MIDFRSKTEFLRARRLLVDGFQGVDETERFYRRRGDVLRAIWRENCEPCRDALPLPSGRTEPLKQENRKMKVGTFEKRKDKKEKVFYALEINIPFFPKMEFYVIDNDKKDKDTKPDFIIFYSGNPIGGIWNKTSNDGTKKYKSGSVYHPTLPGNRLHFAIFQAESGTLHPVSISDRKEEKGSSGNNAPPDVEPDPTDDDVPF